ncbi:MAG: SOS response-associated peptidase [Betaproteobacteria bacterium]|nr:SOS response-associated peptidase [Betaproteobacteria bacterium]
MCGRYELKASAKELVKHFQLLRLALGDVPQSDEIRPTDSVLMLTGGADGYAGSLAKWGLVGSFLDQAPRSPLINLRSEELEAKPFYGRLLKRQRCLIPATAFFEWQSVYGGGKQKMRISDAKGKPLMLAGVFDHHRVAGTTCAILTMAANDTVAPIHDRMPVILGSEEGAVWLGDHAEFPSDEFSEIVQASAQRSLSVSPVVEPEVSPQLSFGFA